MKPPVLFDSNDQIATITLNRPERRNAINLALKIKHLIEYRNTVSLAGAITNERRQFKEGGAIPSSASQKNT